MVEYLNGKKLYGNDFSYDQIKKWYDEEAEAYADLGSKDKDSYTYSYNMMNKIHGFNKIKVEKHPHVLGFGSAWGYEFEPIINKISQITIIEPSDSLLNNKIGNITPSYIKPSVDGRLEFNNNTFNLITCFGTLHHVPNVSFVLGELIRVLQSNGYLLLREPIISMGDWRKQRKGLTKNERGIPVSIFDTELSKYPIEIVSKEYCFTATTLIHRAIGVFLKKPVHAYKTYVLMDKYLSILLKRNVTYHATKKINKIAPNSIFYVIKKV